MGQEAKKKERPASAPRRRDARRTVYLGEGFHAAITIGDKPVRAHVVDVNPSGLGIVIAKQIPEPPVSVGLPVRVEYRDRQDNGYVAQGVVCNVVEVVMRAVEYLRVGVRFEPEDAKGYAELTLAAEGEGARLSNLAVLGSASGVPRPSQAFPCGEGMLPTGFFDDAFFFLERIHFEVLEFRGDGLRFRTPLENKSLLPNLVVKARLFLPRLGVFDLHMRIARVEVGAHDGQYVVVADFVKPDPTLLEAVAEYLMFASPQASVRALQRAGFRSVRIRHALSFKSVTTPEEMNAVLKLRQLDAIARAGGVGRDASTGRVVPLPPEAFSDRFDEFARKVLCRVGRKIVAACRLVFVEGERERSEFYVAESAIPAALLADGFVEVSRLNWHAHYSSPDLFFYMMQNLTRIVMESGNRFLVIAVPPQSWPIYRKLGYKVVAERLRVESLGGTPALLLRLDVPRVLRGLEEIDQSTFKSVYLPVAKHLGIASYVR